MALQIKGKFLEAAAVDGDKLLLQSGQAIRVQVGVDGNGDPVVVRLIERDIESGKVKVDGANVALEAELLAEIAAREASDSLLATTIQALVQAEAESRVSKDDELSASISAERSDREAAVTELDVKLNTEKSQREAADMHLQNQINDILSNTDASALDSLSEIVAAFQSADSDLSTAITDVLGTHTSELNTAKSELQNAILNEASERTSDVSELSSRLTVIEGAGEGSVAKAEADAKAYADAAVLVEKQRAETRESELQAAIQTASGSADGVGDSLSAEVANREAADQALQNALDEEIQQRQAEDTQIASATQLLIEGEAEARIAGDASTLASAKSYTDAQVSALVSSAPGLLDTLDELAAALNDDANFATTVTGQIAGVQSAVNTEVSRAVARENEIEAALTGEVGRATTKEGQIETALNSEISRATVKEAEIETALSSEITRASGIENGLDGRLTVIEARLHRKEKFVISATDIANGFVLLEHKAMDKSIVASVGRLMIHEADEVVGQAMDAYVDDFIVDNSGSVSKIVFVGNMVEPSEEQLGVGDILYVKYMNV